MVEETGYKRYESTLEPQRVVGIIRWRTEGRRTETLTQKEPEGDITK